MVTKADKVLAESESLGEAFARLANMDDTFCLVVELEADARRLDEAFWGENDGS
jgi:hypothetical protein